MNGECNVFYLFRRHGYWPRIIESGSRVAENVWQGLPSAMPVLEFNSRNPWMDERGGIVLKYDPKPYLKYVRHDLLLTKGERGQRPRTKRMNFYPNTV